MTQKESAVIDYIKQIMCDDKGEASSSRWLALGSFIALIVFAAMARTAAPENAKVLAGIIDSLAWMSVLCVGAGQASKGMGALQLNSPSQPTVSQPAPPSPAESPKPPEPKDKGA